jgi:hypothetical protein
MLSLLISARCTRLIFLSILLFTLSTEAGAQVFVLSNPGLHPPVREYTTEGAWASNTIFLNTPDPRALAISGTDLFVADFQFGSISHHGTTGGLLGPEISGLVQPVAMTISGSNLYVANAFDSSVGSGTIGKYTTAGATVATQLVSFSLFSGSYGDSIGGVAVSGNNGV